MASKVDLDNGGVETKQESSLASSQNTGDESPTISHKSNLIIHEPKCNNETKTDKSSMENTESIAEDNKPVKKEETFKAPFLPISQKIKSPVVSVVEITVADNKTEQKNTKKELPFNYKPPIWGGIPKEEYSFDVLKNGVIISNIPLENSSLFVFGRLPSCDITLEHPSLSRYHAVIQYSNCASNLQGKGWYIYDLDSTHGTFVNKKKISPKVFHRLKVGYVVKFGGSSRLHILQGPSADEDEESEMTVTELIEQKNKQKKEAEVRHQAQLAAQAEEQRVAEAEDKKREDAGCSWGMGDDAAEEEMKEQPMEEGLMLAENESLYIDDPKKALKGFYEREGCDLPDYQFTEVSIGKHKCRVELPVDGPNGEELVAEVTVSGKKKDAVIACALEACRLLDRHGMLRSSTHESRKRKKKNWEENDFYDSDEDTFLDRTGSIEKKRNMRMKKAGKDKAETYESLIVKHSQVSERIAEIETQLEKAKQDSEASSREGVDELDAYMLAIKAGAMDTKTKMSLKGELLKLKMDEQSLRRLANIAKPASLPPLQHKSSLSPSKTSPKVMDKTSESLANKLHSRNIQQKKQQRSRHNPQSQYTVETKPDNYQEEEEEEVLEKLSPKLIELTKEEEVKSVRNVSKRPTLPDTNKSENQPPHKKSSKLMSTASVLDSLDRRKSSKTNKQMDPNYDASDPDYAVWLPPTEQSGDGRTRLNDKLGY